MRNRIDIVDGLRAGALLSMALLAVVLSPPLRGANVVPNPGFTGSGGLSLPIGAAGVVNAPSGVPDLWRAFAVEGNIDLEVVPLAADEIFPGSPATNGVLFRVNGFGADQGFDDDNGRFEIVGGMQYQATFYAKSANADSSDQSFNFGFPLFEGPPAAPGAFLGVEPGGAGGLVATSTWQQFAGPSFVAPGNAGNGHISWRCNGDGGEDAILIALPEVPAPVPPPPPGENVVPNPEFAGSGGLSLPIGAAGVVNAPSGVPDFWRAFAVEGNIDLEIVPVAPDEIFPGNPVTNAVLFRVNGFGADQGFDDDNGRFEILAGSEHQATFYARSANADGSNQSFNLGFPLFEGPPSPPGAFLGVEPGGAGGLVATSSWQRFTGPAFAAPPNAGSGHVSWRLNDDGGENAILIALPFVPRPEIATVSQIAGDCNQDGGRNIADVTCEVRLLFAGFFLLDRTRPPAPCPGGPSDPGNVAVLDVTGEGTFDLSDLVSLARYLFSAGAPPAQGEDCFGVPEPLGCSADPGCP